MPLLLPRQGESVPQAPGRRRKGPSDDDLADFFLEDIKKVGGGGGTRKGLPSTRPSGHACMHACMHEGQGVGAAPTAGIVGMEHSMAHRQHCRGYPMTHCHSRHSALLPFSPRSSRTAPTTPNTHTPTHRALPRTRTSPQPRAGCSGPAHATRPSWLSSSRWVAHAGLCCRWQVAVSGPWVPGCRQRGTQLTMCR